MKKLILILCISVVSSVSIANESKVTGDMVLNDKASATVDNSQGYNDISRYATTPRESSEGSVVKYGGSFKTYGRCWIVNIVTGGCSCPAGYQVRQFDTYAGTTLYTCEQRN